MTSVAIEYCVSCGLLESAIEVQKAVLDELGQNLGHVRLIPGDGGVFEVHVDDDVLWERDAANGQFDLDALINEIRGRTDPSVPR